jgi:two-component system chemotaxis response regulator CheB
MIRVLIAEDSVTAREMLRAILRSDPGITIVGEAVNGLDAIAMTKQLRPSVVTMDILMTGLDGFEATRRIMVESPTPIVIISGIYDTREVEISMQALQAGALAVLAKPPGPGSAGFDEECRRLVSTVKAMAHVKVVRRWPEQRRVESPPLMPILPKGIRVQVVAMTASTGGPAALARILSDLPEDFGAPVLLVQHIAPGFVDGLVSWLNTIAPMPVRVPADGESLRPATIYVAPDHHHLGVADRGTITVSRASPVGGFRPSGTFLFESVAMSFGSSMAAVILTGMGDDGVAGLRAVRNAGGRVIAQDEQTSIVYGMPGAAVAEGLVDVTMPLAAIGPRLRELAR